MRRRGTSRQGPAIVLKHRAQPLGRLEQLVLRGDGLTTTALEILTGRTITVRVHSHWRLPLHDEIMYPADEFYTGLDAPDLSWLAALGIDHLDAAVGDELLIRDVLLTGDDGVDYAAAAVVAVLDRLPASVARDLASTDEPIGRMLAAARVPVSRELRDWGMRRLGVRGASLGVDADGMTPARTYLMRLVDDGRPLCLITEWFAPRVFEESS
ncbi:chorismate pyruvate-lyase family protein [Micromonospora craniellae]|uniref:DUF98 domain-containing protein n=1 Tax=Micromonospora craniellae TaxID=2294034 RepID=A0A372G636_9ACTN|nr:chorismate pyruvate-lyase family protein [Micromonospora craniellae]QOC90141.1 DUF98 domain-containing protein [Micromonospora craniellae]RFS48472.1 DUF98 domain-containing protein [Micromonospora craniellae]